MTQPMTLGGTPQDPSTGAAISIAAGALGLPDPVALELELSAVDVDGLLRWFGLADGVARALSAGGHRLGDVLGTLAAGWSSPAPRVAVMRQWEAARTAERIIRGQVDAADAATATLRQTRLLAGGRVAMAVTALQRIGWPAGDVLLTWAALHGQLPAVTAVLSTTSGDLVALRNRNEAALLDLSSALRSDPRESAQQLMPAGPALGAYGTSGTSAIVGGGAGTVGAGTVGAGPVGAGAIGAGGGGAGIPGRPTATGAALQAVDAANTDRLTRDLHSTDVSTVLMALGVTGALSRARENGRPAHLLIYESANSGSQGRAAIGIGDLASADNVAVVVPGIGNAPADIGDGVTDATALLQEAQRQAPTDTTAVLAWYGYDIPLSSIDGVPVTAPVIIGNAAAATDDANASSGGDALIDDMAGFRQLAPANARWVAIGFSMGSTTVSAAAARGGSMDDLVLLGSPGAGRDVDTAADYRAVPPEHTFVTAFEQDPVTRGETDLLAALAGAALKFPPSAAPFGPDPATRSFGAQVVDVDSNEPVVEVNLGPGILGPLGALDSAITNEALDLAHHQQSNYLAGGSLRAVASVVVGHYADVPIKPGR